MSIFDLMMSARVFEKHKDGFSASMTVCGSIPDEMIEADLDYIIDCKIAKSKGLPPPVDPMEKFKSKINL